MTPAVRRAVVVAGLAVLGVLTVYAVTGLPDFGHPRGPYATAAVKLMVKERHAANTVNGVTYDLRGIDTLGEELILFCAAVGSTLLIRAHRAESGADVAADESESESERMPDSMRALGAALVGPALVLGGYIVVHGHLSPGGGFQGGVILAAALLLVYVAGQVLALERVRPVELVELSEAVGAAAFALIAIAGLVFGVAAMANFLPYGSLNSLLSAGTIPILSVVVGVEVTGAIALILTEFLDQALLRWGGEEE